MRGIGHVLAAVCGGAALAIVGTAAASPEDPGTHTFQKSERTESIAGKDVAFDLFVPDGAGPFPAVAVGHGFQRSKAKMVGWGEALASRGYVAASVDFPGMIPDYGLNGKVVSGVLDWLVAQSADPQSPLFGRVDGSRRAAVGHSAGGLAAIVAASQDSRIAVVVGLDAVDNADFGKQRASLVGSATVIVGAPPATCNAQGNVEAIYPLLGGPKMMLRVKDAVHCDPESPSDALCGLLCGGNADAARHALFRRYAFAMLDYVMLCDTKMLPWLGGASAQADTGIEGLVSGGPPPQPIGCPAPGKDSGVAADSAPPAGDAAAGRSDGGPALDGAVDSAVAADSAPSGKDAGPAGGDEDDGCGCAAAPAPSALPLFAFALVALAWVARRLRG
jgi:MYXO-CTERM domain-containing protein